jgi:hypothetical protein
MKNRIVITSFTFKLVTWAKHVERPQEIGNAYKILTGNPERKRPLARHMRRLEDNIKMDFREIALKVVYWMHLAQGRDQWRALVNTVTNFRVHKRLIIS